MNEKPEMIVFTLSKFKQITKMVKLQGQIKVDNY